MIISDTLHYRADGTVSGVTRVTRETYRTPSGRDLTEDVSSTLGIEAVTALLDSGYAGLGQHNATLEAQIVTERDTAASDKAAALRAASEAAATALSIKDQEHAAELARKNEVIAQKDKQLAAARAEKDVQ